MWRFCLCGPLLPPPVLRGRGGEGALAFPSARGSEYAPSPHPTLPRSTGLGDHQYNAPMLRQVLLGAVVLIIAGCVSEPAGQTTVPDEAKRLWSLGISPEQAAALPPEPAKAVLVARAYLEQQAKNANATQPQFLSFEPTASRSGWDVRVQFVGAWRNGDPTAGPGFLTIIQIDRQWRIVRLRGGG